MTGTMTAQLCLTLVSGIVSMFQDYDCRSKVHLPCTTANASSKTFTEILRSNAIDHIHILDPIVDLMV